MATCDQSKCSTVESEQTGYVCCSLCLEDGSRTTARHYCVDCEIYYCGKCVKYHNKIPSTKLHHVNDIESTDSNDVVGEIQERGNMSVEETLRCTIHDGKLIDTYCKDHDKVCCGTCTVVKHRLCSTESINEASNDFETNPEVNKSKEGLTSVLVELKQEKEKLMENVDAIGQQKVEMIEAVDKYEDKIIEKVKELAIISRQKIRSKYEEHKTVLDIDVQALDAAMTTTTSYVDKLERPGAGPKLFASVKNSKVVIRDGERLLQEMHTELKSRTLIFHFEKTLEIYVDGLNAFGELKDDCSIKEYKATVQKTVNITHKKGATTSVYGICFMDAGNLILANYTDTKLQQFNSNLLYQGEILLSCSPLAVCKIDQHEVAVRLSDTKMVQFVSVDQSMKLTSSIRLADTGYGMTYDADSKELFACEGDKVNVYNKTGNKLRTYHLDTNGKPIFSKCRQIALSDKNTDIYVTDKAGLVVLDESGQLKMKVPVLGMEDAWPLCILPGGICLTGSESSGVIVQIDKDGKLIGTLIDDKGGRSFTNCAAYDQKHSKLIVGGYPGVLSVYTLLPK